MKRARLLLDREMPYEVETAYQTLRANLLFECSEKQTIGIISAKREEGKSLVAMRLGISLAKAGRKVLLLDADLRNSAMQAHISVDSGPLRGTSDFLSGQCTVEDVICSTDVPGLYLIPAGTCEGDPGILFENARCRELLGILKKVFDLILVDTTALETAVDAAVVARRCDGALLITESGRNRGRDMADPLQLLMRSRCPLIGVVLTKQP